MLSDALRADEVVWNAVQGEIERQQFGLEMIASENYASRAVMAANGSLFTNKYAEGYPGARYYGGNEFTDVVESAAQERLKKIYGCEYANVQPHSGAQANSATFMALLNPGYNGVPPTSAGLAELRNQPRSSVLGFDLACGGHLTHGMFLNSSGVLYNFVTYKVHPETHLLDFDEIARLAREHRPRLIIAGYSAYPREIPHWKFREIADEVGALLMVDMAHYAGLVAAGVHDNPVKHAHVVTSTTHKSLRGPRGGIIMCREEFSKVIDKAVFPGQQGGPLMHVVAAKAVCFGEALKPEFKEYGARIVANAKQLGETLKAQGMSLLTGGTDNHLILVDVTSVGVGGKQAQELLEESGITVNKNAIPFDKRKPMDPSGIRIGTPALTTRGMGLSEMKTIGGWIAEVLKNPDRSDVRTRVKGQIKELCKQFPAPL